MKGIVVEITRDAVYVLTQKGTTVKRSRRGNEKIGQEIELESAAIPFRSMTSLAASLVLVLSLFLGHQLQSFGERQAPGTPDGSAYEEIITDDEVPLGAAPSGDSADSPVSAFETAGIAGAILLAAGGLIDIILHRRRKRRDGG